MSKKTGEFAFSSQSVRGIKDRSLRRKAVCHRKKAKNPVKCRNPVLILVQKSWKYVTIGWNGRGRARLAVTANCRSLPYEAVTMHEGHRQRMLQRLEREEGIQDHELLEILLFNAIPRKNTNPLAHELLTAFPSLGAIFCASYEELLNVEGVGPETAAYLRTIGILMGRIRGEGERPPVLFSAGRFSDFLRGRFASLHEEVIEIFALDAQQRVRSSKRFSLSLSDRAAAEPEQINAFLAARRPTGLVIAHNHPSAPALPSAEDDRFTAQIQVICSMNNVRFYDHIIVGQDGTYSYFLVGRMEEIRRKFNLSAIVGEGLYRG